MSRRKNIFLLISVIIISAFALILCACQAKTTNNIDNMFVKVGESTQYANVTILYDRDTKVMYSMSNYDSNSGILTLLVKC